MIILIIIIICKHYNLQKHVDELKISTGNRYYHVKLYNYIMQKEKKAYHISLKYFDLKKVMEC
jgi:hypothetical protein